MAITTDFELDAQSSGFESVADDLSFLSSEVQDAVSSINGLRINELSGTQAISTLTDVADAYRELGDMASVDPLTGGVSMTNNSIGATMGNQFSRGGDSFGFVNTGGSADETMDSVIRVLGRIEQVIQSGNGTIEDTLSAGNDQARLMGGSGR